MNKPSIRHLRRSLFTLLLVLSSTLAFGPRAARCEDWPHWLGPRHDGSSAEKGWLKKWPEKGPPRLWEQDIGSGYSSITTSGGRLLLFHRVENSLHVDSLDPGTGKRQWRFSYPTDYEDLYGYDSGPRCAPAVYQGAVYTLGPKGLLHCLEVETGKKRWMIDIRTRYSIGANFFGTGATPLVTAGKIFCNLGGIRFITEGKRDGMAFAFDAKTGKELWKTVSDGGSYASPSLAEIDGAKHLFIFHRGGLSCYDPATGKERWKFPWHARFRDSVNGATPLVVGDKVFFSATYGIGSVCLQVRKDSYKTVWKDDISKRGRILDIHWTPPNYLDGHLYAFSGRNPPDAMFKCVELATGKVKWEWRSYFYRGSMIYSDGHFIAMGEFGDLALLQLSPAGHKELTRVPRVLTTPAWTVPTLSGGLLYLRDTKKLICMDLRAKKK
ncbi:MAG: PQQ-binding-like beta-propeller repeat protein [Planctomycetota bacterium]|nr:PQQ-binding-like beta-propeller repeat protein [Planctomycetota bacterium]